MKDKNDAVLEFMKAVGPKCKPKVEARWICPCGHIENDLNYTAIKHDYLCCRCKKHNLSEYRLVSK